MEITFKFWRKEALLQQKGWIQATHTDQIQLDTHFVKFLPTILIAWNFLLVVAWFLSVRYLQFFVHATTTQLLCTKFYNNHPFKHYIKFLWNWKFYWKILKLSQCPLSAGTFQLYHTNYEYSSDLESLLGNLGQKCSVIYYSWKVHCMKNVLTELA